MWACPQVGAVDDETERYLGRELTGPVGEEREVLLRACSGGTADRDGTGNELRTGHAELGALSTCPGWVTRAGVNYASAVSLPTSFIHLFTYVSTCWVPVRCQAGAGLEWDTQ